jgi:hypothetical protein
MPERVEQTDPAGVDYGWVMQVTFVVTILAGAPIVAVLSLGAELSTWGARAEFALRVGAVVWFCTSLAAFGYAKKYRSDSEGSGADSQS